MGGGDDTEEQNGVSRIAGALRQLGETVNAPGMKAIYLRGVLLVLENGITQADAATRTGSTVKSIRKYRPLVEKLLAALGTATVGAVAASSVAAIAGRCQRSRAHAIVHVDMNRSR